MEKDEFRRNADDMIYLTICAIKGIVPEQKRVEKLNLPELFEVCQRRILKVPGFGMTIDEMLVYIPQQTALKKKLDKMRSRLPKERINTGFSRTSNFIEYNYCNYDVKKVQSDFEEVSKRLAEAQMAPDRINTTVEFEADI